MLCLPAGITFLQGKAVIAVLLVFTASYLSSRTAAATKCSVHDEVEIYHPNVFVNGTEKYQCVPCPKCPFGQGGSVECGTRVPRGTLVECRACVVGESYSDVHDRGTCKPCPDCGNKLVLQECSLREKTVCSDDCKLGFYYKSVTRTCEKCSPCCLGKKYAKYNIYPDECKNMPLDQKCKETHFTDKCPHARVSSTASHPTATSMSSKTKTTLKTTPHPKSVNARITTSISEKKENRNHDNTNITTKEDCNVGVYVILGCLLLAITCIIIAFACRIKLSACKVPSNNSSTTSIPDATFSDAYPMDKTGRTEDPDTATPFLKSSQSGAKQCTKGKRSVHVQNREFQGLKLNESYSDSEQEMLEEEETKLIKGRHTSSNHIFAEQEEFCHLLEKIPEDLHLSRLPGNLRDNVIKRLDTPSKHFHGWHKIGSEMELDKVNLNYLKTEYQKETGSPTTQLFEMLNAKYASKMTIRKFVKVLHKVQRDDIAISICNWPWKEEESSCRLIMSE